MDTCLLLKLKMHSPAVSANMMHNTNRDWPFFRQVAREILWPKIDSEYQQELQGIAEGLNARTGSPLDVYDIVAMNSFEEVPDYYVPWLNKQEKAANPPKLKSPGNCSAFVATGSWTKDGQDRHRPQQLDELCEW